MKQVVNHIIKYDNNMLRYIKSRILLLVISCSIAFNPSCSKPSEEPYFSALPPFNDPVPYITLGQGTLVFYRIGPPGNAYSGLYIIDIEHDSCYNIDCGFINAPSVSPNGEMIACSKWGTDQTAWDIYLMDIDGTNQRDITNLVGNECTPSWTFDCAQLLFSLDCFYTTSNFILALYRQSPVPDPDDRVQIIDYVLIDPPSVNNQIGSVSSSVTGRLLVLLSGLYTFDADGSNMHLILPSDENSDHFVYSPAWSPDGSKIAVLSYKRNSDIAVVLFDSDGTNPDTIVSLSATGTCDWLGHDNQISLCWSPDGNQLAFTRPDGLEVGSHIYIIGKDGTGLQQVTFEEGVTDFSISWSH